LPSSQVTKNKINTKTAGGQNPAGDARGLMGFFAARKINATWVPIYEVCKYTVANPRYLKIVRDSDAVFLAGGFSDKLQECLFGDKITGTSPILEEIKKKKIILGTSAGAMVMPMENMLLTRDSVSSYKAVVDGQLPFRKETFKMFSMGLIDAHTSERGRQGRLMVFAKQTGAKFSFGIDENTAILEKEPHSPIEIIGEKGVVVFPKVESLKNGKFHYLTHGDTMNQNGEVKFPEWKKPCSSSNPPTPSTNIFTDFKSRSIEVAQYNKTSEPFKGHVGRTPVVEVVLQRHQDTKSMCGTFDGKEYISFSNLFVSMEVKTKEQLGFSADEASDKEPFEMDE
jgi:cyanophycinase-like exopeptidase